MYFSYVFEYFYYVFVVGLGIGSMYQGYVLGQCRRSLYWVYLVCLCISVYVLGLCSMSMYFGLCIGSM